MVLWVISVLVAALLLTPLLTAAYVVGVARQDDRTATDAIVVLGAAQYWNRPSPVLQARLEHAKTLLDAGVAPQIITVGGNQPGDMTTEAQAGKRWLTQQGVPAAKVTAVSTGADTLASLTAVAVVMAEHGWVSATLVTDPVHEARSQAMARALGIAAHTSGTQQGSGSSLTLDYVVRETGGLLVFWLRDRRDVAPVITSS